MWDTSCPVQTLTLVAMQDVFSSIVVTVQFSSTVRARVPSHTQVFLDDASTTTTGLRCAMRSHFHNGATSLFRFVATHGDEGSPACIQDTLIQAAFCGSTIGDVLPLLILFGSRSGRHVVDLQVFKDERTIVVHQLVRLLLQ